jgi:L-methionine (R)-S-oxide reductase
MLICAAMSRHLTSDSTDLLQSIEALWDDAIGLYGNLSNMLSLIQQQRNYWWIGFYECRNDELQLSVFVGPPACTRIPKGKGVCGHCWETLQPVNVPDVHQFPGHIACSDASCSELVVPVFRPDGGLWGVLDIDSTVKQAFSTRDEKEMMALSQRITQFLVQYV